MSSWSPFFALAIFPLAYFVVINPVGFSWSFHHGLKATPPELLEKAQYTDRYVVTTRNIIVLGLLTALIVHQSIPAARIGLNLKNWPLNTLIGVSAGLMVVTLQGMVWKFLPSLNKNPNNPELRSGPVWFWIVSTLFGAFAEELWIAVCIVVLIQTSHSILASVLVTAIIFGLLHYGYRFGGILAIASYGAISGSLFVLRGSVLPLLLFHFIGNVGVLYWIRRGAALPRRVGV